MIVPTAWWHATCNAADTVSLGGQDMCGLERNCLAGSQKRADAILTTPPREKSDGAEPMEWRLCDVPSLEVACHGRHGVDNGRALPPRLLQPLWRLGHELPFDIVAREEATVDSLPSNDYSVLGIGRLVRRPRDEL